MTSTLDRIRGAFVGLKVPPALEALDHTMQKLEQGEISGIEALDALLSEEYATRETRRIDVALKTVKLRPIKTLEGFDFTFQPSLDRERITALAQPHRSDTRTHPHKCPHHTAAIAKTARSSTKKWSRKSRNRLTTEAAKLGNFSLPVLGKFEMPLTLS